MMQVNAIPVPYIGTEPERKHPGDAGADLRENMCSSFYSTPVDP